MIKYEKEVCNTLSIPSIPKKTWDGKSSFKDGVAVLRNSYDESEFYAIATFNSETDERPSVKCVFGLERYDKIAEIFVVPSYMDTDVKKFDLDAKSMKAAQAILNEAEDIIEDSTEDSNDAKNYKEYFFENIHNDDEARAYIAAYNKAKGIRGHMPKTHEGLVMRLGVIYKDTNK